MAVSRPTVDDLLGWIKLQQAPSEEALAVYTESMDVALDLIESRIDLPEGTSDTDYPQRVRSAVILTAARHAKRAQTPEGVMGTGPDLAVVRVGSFDPDVERLIARYRKVNGFY